jgi:hypothetical protein
MRGLSCAINVTRLHIDVGIFGTGDPNKAATEFWKDASKFLEAVSAKKGEKGAGVDVLSLGRMALTLKEGKGNPQPWTEPMRAEFVQALKGKMK